MKTVLIVNPTSGISTVTEKRMSPEETERSIIEGLRVYGIEPKVYHTTSEDTGRGLAKRAAEEQAELVIAVGGDGTIHEVAKGLIGTRSILGIIPTGTMNNLAHSLNIPDTIPDACTAIVNGETRSIDVGKINDHIFLEVAGVGLDAALFPAAEDIKRQGLLTNIHGAISGLRTLLRFKPARVRITIDKQQRRPYRALQVTICNAPIYGAHMQAAPGALMDDGLLDIVVYKDFNKFEYLRHALSISQGRRPYQPKLKYLRVRSLRVDADQPLEFHTDGEVKGKTPAFITILPGALHVRVSGKQAPGLKEEAIRGKTEIPIHTP